MNWATVGEFVTMTFADAILITAGFHLAVLLVLVVYLVFSDVLPKE